MRARHLSPARLGVRRFRGRGAHWVREPPASGYEEAMTLRLKRWTGEAKGMPPRHWTPNLDAGSAIRNQHDETGKVVALVTCIRGHVCSLRIGPGNHSIDASGAIQPSLACPIQGCDGHENPGTILEDWLVS